MAKNNSTKNPFSSYGLRSFVSFCRPWRYKLTFVAMLFTTSSVLIAIQPIFIGKLVDAVTAAPLVNDTIWLFAILLIAASVLHNLLWRAAEIAFRGFVFEISFQYETYLFREVIAKPYKFFVDKFTGKISSYITNSSGELKGLLSEAMFSYIGSIVSVVSVVLIMTSVNWQTGLIVAVCLAIQILIGRFTLAKDMAAQKVEADINSTKNGHIVDAIANFVSVKSFRKESTEHRQVGRQQASTLKAAKRSFFWGIVFWGTQSILIRDIMWPAVVLLNLWMFMQGDITVGQFTTVLTTALLFTQVIWEIIWHVSQFGQRVSRIEEAHTYLFGTTNIVKTSGFQPQPAGTEMPFHDSLEIRQLSFAYPDNPSEAVLNDISISLPRGGKIGIVGRSGSGKSTLTKLLLDQYPAPSGTLLLDQLPVSSQSLSKLVTFVPQDTALFHRSIADNIAYAAETNVTREQIIRVAKDAEAHEFIVKLPDGYDTLVGERGVKLSGGQRQRIAIARAVLRDAPILVLDEATSALDSESEIRVQHALENLWQHKTVIAIAHRLSTLRNMDQIIVMDSGRIVEQGTHRQLLAKDGIYAKLWAHQSGGFIEE